MSAHCAGSLARVISDRPDGAVLVIVATAKAGANGVGPVELGAVRVRVTAPAVEGAANAAIVTLLARITDVPPSRVKVIAGQCARRKRVHFAGIDAGELARRLRLDDRTSTSR